MANTTNSDSENVNKNSEDDIKFISYPRKQSRGKNNVLVKSTVSYNREDVVKWYGWGYKDTYFYKKDGITRFSGNSYSICEKDISDFTTFIKEKLDMDFAVNIIPKELVLPLENEYPKSRISDIQLRAIKALDIKISLKGSDRLVRSHGQGNKEIDNLRRKIIGRIPDLVIWPTCHEDVVEIVKVCDKHDIVIIPIGGGTNITLAVECPEEEERPIVTLDTSVMNEILWIDHESLVACVESGIIGQDLERELNKLGYTSGHDPDSSEFSTLGGWISTRASGMKKNTYGNIEDIMVHAKMVTPSGILDKRNRVPRMSCGPDFNHVILGSEGCFGVITDVIIKIRPLPECSRYGSLVFPDFESGVGFMREVAKQRRQPSSLRLMDNGQYQFGKCLRGKLTYCAQKIDDLKMSYLTYIKGFDLDKMVVATIVYEGDEDDVNAHEAKINAIAGNFGGIPGGEGNGKRGYDMTFVIAYVRDIAFELNIICESIETSIPWDKVMETNDAVNALVTDECQKLKISKCLIMSRVTQTYDAGAVIYFYFTFNARDVPNRIQAMEYIKKLAKNLVVEMGGAISHHHGIGKANKALFEKTISPTSQKLLKATKSQLDPNNIFGTCNFTSGLSCNNNKI